MAELREAAAATQSAWDRLVDDLKSRGLFDNSSQEFDRVQRRYMLASWQLGRALAADLITDFGSDTAAWVMAAGHAASHGPGEGSTGSEPPILPGRLSLADGFDSLFRELLRAHSADMFAARERDNVDGGRQQFSVVYEAVVNAIVGAVLHHRDQLPVAQLESIFGDVFARLHHVRVTERLAEDSD